MEIYKIENLTFTYPNRENAALCGVDLAIGSGDFITICGPSGCGKTTLLRHLKPSTLPHGARTGDILFDGKALETLSARDAAAKIGFVFQSPENQIVTDKVWHELAFGLESLGLKTPEIRLRVAEMASFFGIQSWFRKSVTELSGGQKQILALASIMAMQPAALILDEPTSQLDPIAAGEFLATIGKINRDLGVSIILTEHRLEEAFPLSTRAVVLDGGKIVADGTPREVGLSLRGSKHGMFLAMPAAMRVWFAMQIKSGPGAGIEEPIVEEPSAPPPGLNADKGTTSASEEAVQKAGSCDEVPLTVRDGAIWLSKQFTTRDTRCEIMEKDKQTDQAAPRHSVIAHSDLQPHFSTPPKPAVEMENVWYKYEKNSPDVIKGLSFKADYGEFTAILGGNGAGKTTALSLIAGLYAPYRGRITAGPQVFTLPQNPQSLFIAKTVREDLLEILSERKLQKDEKLRRLTAMVRICGLENILDSHPYDLSGGEQQRAALAKVLLLQPKILLLDEPTKGLDAEFKHMFAAILKKLTTAGTAVIMASHDVEFCAEYADRCALFFDGGVVTENTSRGFFSGNSFYTTSANRMSREIMPGLITAGDIVAALGGNDQWTIDNGQWIIENALLLSADEYAGNIIDSAPLPAAPVTLKLSAARKAIAGVFAAVLIAVIVFAGFHFNGLKSFISGGSEAVAIAEEGAPLYIGIMLTIAAGIIGITLALTYRRARTRAPADSPPPTVKPRRSKRTIAAAVMALFAIPLTIYAGIYFFGDRKYYFVSLLIVLETMLPFILVFESRKPQARELVIIAVLCAVSVAGRAAFFMLPQFKPVAALVIIAGVAFGGEAGFLVGAMTGFVSNFFFGQGPWTPYQMFALGIIGFLAGILFRNGALRRSPAGLAVFGAFATFIIYGGIMNPAHILIFQSGMTREMVFTAYLQGIPFDLVHAAATLTFMLIISAPMLEKLDRIKIKYGLTE